MCLPATSQPPCSISRARFGCAIVLHRADLAPYANILTGIEVQLQGYIVTRRYAVWPRNSGCPENYSLTTNANFGTDDVAPTQRSFYICRDKLEDRPMDSHTIYHVSGRACLRLPFTESPKRSANPVHLVAAMLRAGCRWVP